MWLPNSQQYDNSQLPGAELEKKTMQETFCQSKAGAQNLSLRQTSMQMSDPLYICVWKPSGYITILFPTSFHVYQLSREAALISYSCHPTLKRKEMCITSTATLRSAFVAKPRTLRTWHKKTPSCPDPLINPTVFMIRKNPRPQIDDVLCRWFFTSSHHLERFLKN